MYRQHMKNAQTFSCHQGWPAETHLKLTSNFLCIDPTPKNETINIHVYQ